MTRHSMFLAIPLLIITGPIGSADEPRPRFEITATFSIVAVAFVRAGVGAFCTQHYHHPPWGPQALDLLESGSTPESVIGKLLEKDPRRELRQLAIIDMTGRVANHNPSQAPERSRYWGAQSGRFYSCQGNTLAGRQVISKMSQAYEDTKGSLADRLVAALVAGDCAGGDHRGRLAAGIRVARRGTEGLWLELRVDKSDDAVIDLLKDYVKLKHPAKGAWPGGREPFKHPCPRRKR